jgi:hypothetical protein
MNKHCLLLLALVAMVAHLGYIQAAEDDFEEGNCLCVGWSRIV